MTQTPPSGAPPTGQAPGAVPKPQTNWIEVSDFSAGIYDDWYNLSGTQPAPDGAAQLTGTYGCVCSPAGGLIPAPRRVKTFSQGSSIFDSPLAPGYYPSSDVAVHVIAMRVFSPIIGATRPPFTMWDQFADQHFIMYSWWYASAGNGVFKERCRFRTHKFYVNQNTPTDVSLQNKTSTGTQTETNGLLPHGHGSIDFTRANSASSTDPGYPYAIHCFAGSIDTTDVNNNFFANYPSTPGTDTVNTIPGVPAGTAPNMTTAHQDRVFYTALSTVQSFGANSGLANMEYINALLPNDLNNSASVNGSVYVAENPSGISSMTTMNASQLFVLKGHGGGFVVAGAFEQPTITRLPGIASGSPPCTPVVIPGGQVVYGNNHGIWGWSGGNQSQRLSPQIDGNFWMDPTTQYFHGRRGRFVYSEPFVFCPNNFLYDTGKKGWWRLNNPASNNLLSWWDTTTAGLAVGSPATLNPANWTVYEWYDTLQGTSSYQWVSQPFQRTRDRGNVYGELTFVASGAGTVQFTLSSALTDPRQPQPLPVVTIPDANPKAVTIPTGFNGTDLVVQINATSTDPSKPAPRIHRFAVPFYTDVTLGRT